MWGKDAVAQINAHDPMTPLFLYLAFTTPHSPYQAPQEYIDKYKDIADPTRRTYAAMMTVMDEEIGKVIEALDQKKMRENTLIVFMSDNGGNLDAKLAGDADVSKLKLPADNGPYRGGKGSLYEGGTRVAALANWPGRIKPGEVKEVMHVVDIFPTLAGLAGASTNKGKPLDGVDVWSTISDGKSWIEVGQFLCQFIAHSLGLVIGHLPTCILFLIFQLCEPLPQFSQGRLQSVALEGGIIHAFAGILQFRARQGGIEGMVARLFGLV